MPTKQQLARFFSHRAIHIAIIAILTIALVNLLAYSYLKTERAIYYWDISAYWKNGIDLLAQFHLSIRHGASIVVQSLSSDYNYLPLLPLLPIMHVLGSSRTIFVLSILNVYIVPFALITTYALSELFKLDKTKLVLFCIITLPTLLLFPSVLAPVFDGRVDGIGLLFMSLILLFCVKTRLSKIWHFIVLGVLICCMFIARRYYSYWALGFFLAFAIVVPVSVWINNKRAINKTFFTSLKRPFLGIITSGLTILAIMLTGFREIFLRYISEDYADIYSAYHLGGFSDQILLFIRNFGAIEILLMLTGLAIAFTKYHRTIIATVSSFIVIQTVIIFLAFTHTQTFGIHHYYMLTPLFLWSFAVLIRYLIDYKNATVKYVCLVSFISTILFLSLYSFVGQRKDTINVIHQEVFGLSENIRPIVRHDLPTLEALSTYLGTVMQRDDYVYILSSSDVFNDDIFRDINLPEPATVNASGVAHVDKRDGFPNYFFDAQYIIVADPIQTHIEPEGQSVITVLADSFLRGEAKNVKEIHSFTIDNGVKLLVYKKDAPYSAEFVNAIRTYFAKKYPTYPSLNNIQYSGK